jgi:hypothetical protein
VLQSDLRGRYRDRFDKSWERKKASLPVPRVPFSVFVELRNQAVKSGELLPRMKVVVRVDHPAVEEATFAADLREGRIVISSEEYKFVNRVDLDRRLTRLQERPVVLKFGPMDDEAFLRFRQPAAEAFYCVDGENGRVLLVVRVEMRPMVGLAGFDVHPDYDSVEPREFRHRPALASSSLRAAG